ncbi:DegT/DnrJ/EryC1/StrS family aminotransferase [bacterium]|nr:DegT/DnrJ/EryC1/StrS family aminotransferase [bacterium]
MIPVMDLNAQDRPAKKAILRGIRGVIDRNEFVQAPIGQKFEAAFGKWLGQDHVVGVNSGTAALFLALKAMGVGPGDEVITTPFTFIATLESILYAGAKPVLADIESDTFCISPAAVERAVTARTKVILPVHLYGHPADLTRLDAVARKAGAKILEDTAQAHGATWNGRKVGTYGAASAFSFYPGKNLGAYGDAGAVATASPEIAERVRLYRNHGRHSKYQHEVEGYNERLDGIQAAVLLAKLPYLDRWVKARRSQALRYNKALGIASVRSKGIEVPPVRPEAGHAYHLYVIRAKEREKVAGQLKAVGVSTAVHYPIPLHLQPCYKHLGHHAGDFPESERAAKEVLSLPLYPGMTKSQQDRVIRAVKNL